MPGRLTRCKDLCYRHTIERVHELVLCPLWGYLVFNPRNAKSRRHAGNP